jgi:CheY-like chemotaxis protein
MPNMSGIHAFKVIKNIKPELPIYIHSGDQMLETQQLYKEIGFDAIIAKPIQQEKLIAAIKETFKATT